MGIVVGRKLPHSSGGRKPAGTSATNKALITRNLKLAFGQVMSEEVPSEWLRLLEELDVEEKKSEGKS